jgi:hypothetical protein
MLKRAEVRLHLAVIAAFAVATLALTYPAFFDLSGSTPGNGYDSPMFVWNEWWFRYALVHGRPLFWTDRIYAPEGLSLVWHTHTVLSALLVLGLGQIFGFLVAHNLLIFASFVFSGYGTFLVARREPGVGVAPAFVAGLVFAFCPKKMVHLLEHPNLLATQYIPLFMWAAMCAVDSKSRSHAIRWTSLAALFFAGSLYTEYTFAFFSAIWFAIFFGSRLIERRFGSHEGGWLWTTAISTGIGAVVVAMPLVALMARDAARGEHPGLHNWGAAVFAGDLKGFFLPPFLHSVVGKTWGYGAPQMESVTTLGNVALLAGVLGLARSWRDRRFVWIATFVFFLVMSFGSTLTWEGRDLHIPLPYRVLVEMPILKTARAPSRFVFVAALGLGVLIAVALSDLERRLHSTRARIGALAAATAVILFEYLAVPYPTVKNPTSAAFEALRREPGDAAVLEVPLGWRDAFSRIGAEDLGLSAAQATHEKRRIGGVIARADPKHVAALERLPFVRRLIDVEKHDPGAVILVGERDHREACELAATVPVGDVLVSRFWRDSAAHRYVRDAMPLSLLADDNGYIAYRVAKERCQDTAALPYLVAVNDPSVHLDTGWSFIEGIPGASGLAPPWVWTTGRAELTMNAHGRRPSKVRLQGFMAEALVKQGVRLLVTVDGAVVYDQVAAAGLTDIEAPVDPAREGDVAITIETSDVWQIPDRKVGFVLKAVGWR